MACRLTPGSAHPCMSPRGRLGASFPCLADPANGLALSTNGDKRGQGQCLPGFYRAVSPAFVVLCSRFGREQGRSPIRRSRRHQRRPRQGAAPSRAMDPCPATKNYVVGAQVWGVESSFGRTSHFQVGRPSAHLSVSKPARYPSRLFVAGVLVISSTQHHPPPAPRLFSGAPA